MINNVENEVNMLARHMEVLQMVVDNEPIGISIMSDESGYAKHEIRYSLRLLQEENLITPTQQGAVTTDQTGPLIETLDEQITEIRNRLIAIEVFD